MERGVHERRTPMRPFILEPLLAIFGCAHKQETKAAATIPSAAPASQAASTPTSMPSCTIENNADERGTEEYNMALGDRRATVVKGYLESLGASSAQLATASYGKENPLCSEPDEACWAQNRRAEMTAAETTSGKPKKTKR
jgi:outer membrane protein OmpA-like peptidoglycan-associated protein